MIYLPPKNRRAAQTEKSLQFRRIRAILRNSSFFIQVRRSTISGITDDLLSHLRDHLRSPQLSDFRVYDLLGEAGTYYGVRFGKNIPWVTKFPFGYIKDPQYVGSILSLLGCSYLVPYPYILLWILGYLFMMFVESNEDPSTRAKQLA